MTDYAELATRLAGALDRIGAGVETLEAAAGGAEQGSEDALREALEAEKIANAQLEERVIAIKEKQESIVSRLEAEVASLGKEIAARDAQISELKQDISQAGSADPQSGAEADAELRAELDALRQTRANDRAELDAILAELGPLVEGGANA